jgi:hypothetical protein
MVVFHSGQKYLQECIFLVPRRNKSIKGSLIEICKEEVNKSIQGNFIGISKVTICNFNVQCTIAVDIFIILLFSFH